MSDSATADTTDRKAVAANRVALGVDNGAELMARYHVGAIIYYEWAGNLESPGRVARLSNGLQRAARASGDPPLLITLDQEHGVRGVSQALLPDLREGILLALGAAVQLAHLDP